MKESTSSGGVVFLDDTVLLLMKYNGDWVLPKGHIEVDEHRLETALREVKEEADVNGTVHEYLGSIHYEFHDAWHHNERMSKTVHWYLMTAKNDHCAPQHQEGFKKACYVDINKALELVRYRDERSIVDKAIKIYLNDYY